ncbi:MAG TPA: protein kinase, partial [Planctomycetota bacterium]|nr:protein kinase [Planctomycetota bacterium]
MDDVQYETLATLLAREGPLPPDRALPLLREATRSLAEAHAAGILHCDLQPATLLVTGEDRVLLAESALARRQGEARVPDAPGTERLVSPLYYPPEAAHARPLDTRADLFLLGASFYHAMTGQPPFDGPDPEARALEYIRRDAPSLDQQVPGMPVLVNVLMQKLLRRDPDERYQSAAELLVVVERTERMLQKRQVARRAPAAASVVEGEGDRRPTTQRVKPGTAAGEGKAERRPTTARVRVGARPLWQTKPFIYASAAGGFLLLVIVVLLLSRGGTRPPRASAVPGTSVAPTALPPESPKPKPSTAAPVKADPGPRPPPPRTSVPAKPKEPSLEERLEAYEREKKERKGRGLSDGADAFVCHAVDGIIEGAVRNNNRDEPNYEPKPDRDCIGYWNPKDSLVKWEVAFKTPGTYQVEILFAAEGAAEGNEYVVSVAGQELRGKVRNTGNWGKFETDNPGAVTIEKAGDCTVFVKAGKKKSSNAPLMNLRAVKIRRAQP